MPTLESGPGALLDWLGRLLDLHPDDPAALAPLFLHLVRLEPGQGLFQAPGVLHCYLGGSGVEVMASSDNVLRAGLTEKAVDLDEVLAIADLAPKSPAPIEPERIRRGLARYQCDAEEFELLVLEAAGEDGVSLAAAEALMLGICTRGEGRLSIPSSGESLALRSGAALAIRPGADGIRLEGDLVVHVATPRDLVV